MAPIEIGKKAPAFGLADLNAKRHALKDYAGRIVVLFFYPKDDTPGCTDEACQFRDHMPDFSKIKAAILGVSPDDPPSHRAFADRHALAFTLLSDRPIDGVPPVCRAYGVWGTRTLYGKKYDGVVRTTYLIDRDGRVARRWDNVNIRGHVGEVLAAVRRLHAGEPLISPNQRPLRLRPRPGRQRRSADSRPPYAPVRGSTRSTRGGRGKGGTGSKGLRSTGAPRKAAARTGGRPRRAS